MSVYRSAPERGKKERIVRAESGKDIGDALVDYYLDTDGSVIASVWEVNSLVNGKPSWRRVATVRLDAKQAAKLSVAQLSLARPDLLAAGARDGVAG